LVCFTGKIDPLALWHVLFYSFLYCNKVYFVFISGGVLIIGGFNGEYLDTIYRLAHAEAKWEKMPQKLKTKRSWLVGFLIPEELANCTIH
jgi:hypothetical protein